MIYRMYTVQYLEQLLGIYRRNFINEINSLKI